MCLVTSGPATRLIIGRTVLGAASRWVQHRLSGPLRPARLVHVGRDALYVVDQGGSCVEVLGRHADERLPALPADIARQASTLGPVDGWGAPIDLAAAAQRQLRVGKPAVVPALLGRGSGLTLIGDDVPPGWMLGWPLPGGRRAPVVATALRLAPTRTTPLSATLLGCRPRPGDPEFATVLDDLARGVPGPALARLTAIGGSSGRGLWLALPLATRTPTVPDHAPHRARNNEENACPHPLPTSRSEPAPTPTP